MRTNKNNPTYSDLHVSAALTDVSVAFAQNPSNFVAARVFPVIPVMKQADKFFIYDRGDWFRSDAQPRAPGTAAARGGWRVSTEPYFAERIALAHPISDPERENADAAVSNLDADASEYVTSQLLLKNEKE